MNTELQQRKKAVQLYYYQHLSKADICRQLPCSCSCLDRWLSRYDPDQVENSLQDRKRTPRHAQYSLRLCVSAVTFMSNNELL